MNLSLEADAFGDLWYSLLRQLRRAPCACPRGLPSREILGVSLFLHDAQSNVLVDPVRNLNLKFMVAEWLWICLGREDLATIARYNRVMARFSDDGQTLAGAYGPRILPQLPYLLAKLREDPDTRQAVATVWTPRPRPSKDVPCTISLQFLLRKDRLHTIATMRSSDAWLGLPYDVFTFSMIGSALAGELGTYAGSLLMQLGSSHLYEEYVDTVWDLKGSETLRSPSLPAWPPFAIEETLVEPGGPHTGPPLEEPWSRYHTVLRSPRVEAERLLRWDSR